MSAEHLFEDGGECPFTFHNVFHKLTAALLGARPGPFFFTIRPYFRGFFEYYSRVNDCPFSLSRSPAAPAEHALAGIELPEVAPGLREW
jgi:hypothetical protein